MVIRSVVHFRQDQLLDFQILLLLLKSPKSFLFYFILFYFYFLHLIHYSQNYLKKKPYRVQLNSLYTVRINRLPLGENEFLLGKQTIIFLTVECIWKTGVLSFQKQEETTLASGNTP